MSKIVATIRLVRFRPLVSCSNLYYARFSAKMRTSAPVPTTIVGFGISSCDTLELKHCTIADTDMPRRFIQ